MLFLLCVTHHFHNRHNSHPRLKKNKVLHLTTGFFEKCIGELSGPKCVMWCVIFKVIFTPKLLWGLVRTGKPTFLYRSYLYMEFCDLMHFPASYFNLSRGLKQPHSWKHLHGCAGHLRQRDFFSIFCKGFPIVVFIMWILEIIFTLTKGRTKLHYKWWKILAKKKMCFYINVQISKSLFFKWHLNSKIVNVLCL